MEKTESNIYPVITLYQPWASFIMEGWKTIETREHDRFKCLKGQTILIHAGLHVDQSPSGKNNPYAPKQLTNLPTGCILGSAFVNEVNWLNTFHSKDAMIDCLFTYRFGLFLENAEKFDTPIPVKGGMGIWYFNLNTKQKVKKHG